MKYPSATRAISPEMLPSSHRLKSYHLQFRSLKHEIAKLLRTSERLIVHTVVVSCAGASYYTLCTQLPQHTCGREIAEHGIDLVVQRLQDHCRGSLRQQPLFDYVKSAVGAFVLLVNSKTRLRFTYIAATGSAVLPGIDRIGNHS